MATITTTPTNTGGVDATQGVGIIFYMLKWLIDHSIWIMFFILVAGVTVFAIVFFLMNEERKKEQEDMLYKEFKDTIRSCKQNSDETMFEYHYRFLRNIIWFGLPFLREKVGRKIFNQRNKIIGHYEGMYIDMLGNYNILLWKTKTFFMKDTFVLRIPTRIYNIRKGEDLTKEEKKKMKKSGNDEIYMQFHLLPKNLITFNEIDKTISVNMVNTKKDGYYFYPVYQDGENQILDLTESINAMNQINNSHVLLDQVIREAGKNVINMAKTNNQLVYEQRKPEKVKDVDVDE